jgi:hypothetical protein
MITSCGPSAQEHLYTNEYSQEGSIVCRSEKQRDLLVSKQEGLLDIWNHKVSLLNETMEVKARDSEEVTFEKWKEEKQLRG